MYFFTDKGDGSCENSINNNKIPDERNNVNKNKFLRVLYFNARSIRNKINELKALIAVENIDVIAISETWTNFNTRDYKGEFELSGFQLFNKDRINKRGGGVLIYCRHNLEAEEINVRAIPALEIVAVKIKGKLNTVNIAVVYRPPGQNADLDFSLYSALTELTSQKEL